MLAALLTPLACAQAQGQVIVVGQVVDQRNNDQESSRDYVIGAKLYFDQVNSSGGISGVRIRQVVRDAGGDPDEALKQTRDLIDREGADVLFGYVGESAIQAVARSDILTRGNIALVSPLTGLLGGTEAVARNVFVSRAPYRLELRKVVEHFQTISVTRIAVIATRADLNRDLVPALRTAAQEGKAQVVFDAYAPDAAAVKAALARMGAAQPQVLIVLGDGLDLGLVAKQIGEQGAIPVVGLSLANQRVVAQFAGRRAANGVVLTQVVPNPLRADTPLTREHLASVKKYLDEPPSHLTLEGYMAAKALVEVLRETARRGKLNAPEVLRTIKALPPRDLGGVTVDYLHMPANVSGIELTMLRSDGTLLH